tara:strand:+ start:525 stop:1244 length:720 start_codon:yes stop_codon:yes gene_type:complete
MARSYGTGTLSLSVTEAITLNGKDEGQTHVHTISSISDVYRRTETILPTAETHIVGFSAIAGLGTFAVGDVKYIRLTNIDDTQFCIVTFTSEDSNEFSVKIDKGQSFILCPSLADGAVNIIDANDKLLTTFTDATCDYDDDPTVGCNASSQIAIGQKVSGTGIPATAYVKSVNTPGAVTSFELGDNPLGGGTNVSTTGGATTDGTLTFTQTAGPLSDLTSIKAIANGANVDLEIYIAMT